MKAPDRAWEVTAFRLNPQLLGTIDELAEGYHLSRSVVIRALILEGFESDNLNDRLTMARDML